VNFLLKYDLFDGHLIVRSVLSLLHEPSATYLTTQLHDLSVIPEARGKQQGYHSFSGIYGYVSFILLLQ